MPLRSSGDCAMSGSRLKLPDAIIAATARTNDLTVLAADDHFKLLPPPWQVRFYTPLPANA